jgi:short-subunit dehydrogenase
MRRILIMGAASAIAEATAREFARRGDSLVLAGRSRERLLAIAQDLKLRGAAAAEVIVQDATDIAGLPAMIDETVRLIGPFDTLLIAHGTRSDQRACEQSPEASLQEFTTNALSVIALCTLVANRFEAQRRGVIAVISSVAGDRGRQSNYVYGASKAAVSTFLSGLRQRLRSTGVRVVTIKPGFVDTPMTAGFLKKGILWAAPATVAAAIARAVIRGTPVVYVPWFWRPIMAIIRAIPEFVFQRLRL